MINDINPLQIQASNPSEGAWVSASAGTGKTKILTDRVIRLLLEGVSPLKILCLTFTNAAAGEMHERILKALRKISDAALEKEQDNLINLITSIIGDVPDHKIIERSRSLYREYLISEDKVAIHTLHSYCQKILQRFPIEAGVSPNFTILDEAGQAEAMISIKDKILKDDELESLNKFFAENFHQSTLDEIFNSILSNRSDFIKYKSLDPAVDIDGLIRKVSSIEYSKYTEILSYPLVQSLIHELGEAPLQLQNPSKEFIDHTSAYEQDIATIGEASVLQLKSLFLTQKGEKRKRIAPAKIAPKGSNTYDELLYIQERIYQMDQLDRKQQVDSYSEILAVLAEYCLGIYESYKKDNGYLDYDDLIIKTKELLCDASSRNWVLYKLDGGIDHLLVDEAQDTSKSQWEIIEAIIQEFFASDERMVSSLNPNSNVQVDRLDITGTRTLFVVGDQKQSIFSFQGADVQCFIDMNNKLTSKLALSGIKFNNIELDVSYRSASAIIDVVYEVFRLLGGNPTAQGSDSDISSSKSRYSIFENIPYLKAHRTTCAGSVELWPVHQKEDQEEEFWPIDEAIIDSMDKTKAQASEMPIISPQERLAKDIAAYIEKEIASEKVLDSTGEKICAGDFLVLFRTRSKLTDLVIEEIQKLSIAVTGLDRIKLKCDTLVQDMISLAKFTINPHDDLNLAGLLKSPFFNRTEEEVYNISIKSKELSKPFCEVVDEELLDKIQDIYKNSNLSNFFHSLANLFSLKDRMHIYYPAASHEYLNSSVSFDSFRELLAAAANYQKQKSNSLQGFIDWFENSDIEIKRATGSNSRVRIMTVHGSKGLQSPYVILCDTTSLPRSYERILKDKDTGKIISAKDSAFTDDRFKTAQQVKKDMEYYEYIRLLYVALTRAEDHLLVCGYNNKKSLPEGSWYSLVQPAIEKLTGIVEGKNQELIKEDIKEHKKRICYTRITEDAKPEITAPEDKQLGGDIDAVSDRSSLTSEVMNCQEELHLHYQGIPASERQNIGIIDKLEKDINDLASDISENPGAAFSINSEEGKPLLKAISLKKYDALEYGKVFHKILEDSVKMAEISTMSNHPLIETISEGNKKRMLDSIEKICANDEFLELLSKGEIKTEISVGVPQSLTLKSDKSNEDKGLREYFKIGRIDLMSVNDSCISIIDYKSDKIEAGSEKVEAEKYKPQLEFYSKALWNIYPDKQINSYILWLETGKLEQVSI